MFRVGLKSAIIQGGSINLTELTVVKCCVELEKLSACGAHCVDSRVVARKSKFRRKYIPDFNSVL